MALSGGLVGKRVEADGECILACGSGKMSASVL